MSDQAPARSVKFSKDERTGWSSDRPRPGGGPPRPANIAVRNQVLAPSDRLRYTPTSLVIVVAPDGIAAEAFLNRVLEDKSTFLSAAKVRRLLTGRVAPEDLEERADAVLESAVLKRMDAGQPVVLLLEGFSAVDRDRWVRPAAALRRPRHLILLEGTAEDQEKGALGDLRRTLMVGDLGEEGFHTAIRLGGSSADEVNRLLFRAIPRDE